MDPGCVLGEFRVPVQGSVSGERLKHAAQAGAIGIRHCGQVMATSCKMMRYLECHYTLRL